MTQYELKYKWCREMGGETESELVDSVAAGVKFLAGFDPKDIEVVSFTVGGECFRQELKDAFYKQTMADAEERWHDENPNSRLASGDVQCQIEDLAARRWGWPFAEA